MAQNKDLNKCFSPPPSLYNVSQSGWYFIITCSGSNLPVLVSSSHDSENFPFISVRDIYGAVIRKSLDECVCICRAKLDPSTGSSGLKWIWEAVLYIIIELLKVIARSKKLQGWQRTLNSFQYQDTAATFCAFAPFVITADIWQNKDSGPIPLEKDLMVFLNCKHTCYILGH